MKLPVIRGVIERRMLVNFRVAPEILAARVPSPFRPQLAGGWGIAGICLIRLAKIRPRGWPAAVGLSSENAAHRIAVEWDADGAVRRGVYIPRRDTSSRLNAWAGGRLFPGVHRRARFEVREGAGRYELSMRGDDGMSLDVDARTTEGWPSGSVFGSLDEASAFFEAGSLGYSDSRRPGTFDGLELRTPDWAVAPLEVERVASSVFDDRRLFPAGSVEFDSALLMRNVAHEWHGRPSLCSEVSADRRGAA